MKKVLLCLTILFTVIFTVKAQERTVSGRVISPEDQLGLPGVTIIIKGTTIGTTTDMNGNFTISGVYDTTILVFSYIGYETQEVEVGTQKVFDIIMKASAEELKEVVRQMPLRCLLTETDSGSPEGVLTVAEKIAELKGLTKDDVGRITTQNLRKLTGL